MASIVENHQHLLHRVSDPIERAEQVAICGLGLPLEVAPTYLNP